MLKISKRIILTFATITLTSCGYSLSYLVEGNKYNSPVFTENFYRHWDSELKDAKQGTQVSPTNYVLSFKELYKIDPNMINHEYTSADAYGEDYKMNSVDDMFNYGYQSKLFDGQVQCLGYYQLARVQTDKDGFSIRFSKESDELDYFAMQFKATTDNTVDCYKYNSEEKSERDADMFHNSMVHLNISLYTKTQTNEIVRNTFSNDIEFNGNSTNNGSHYVFYAFSLKEYNLSRLMGISVTYTFDDELIDWNKTKGIDIDYSLMIYEMFIPYTNWH